MTSWNATRLRFLLCLSVLFCLVMCNGAPASGADIVSDVSAIRVAPGEWFLRLDESGHEGAIRTEIRSDGTIRSLDGRKGLANWKEKYAGTIKEADLAKIYESARTVVQVAKPIDQTFGRDVDAFQELIVVTSTASYRIEFAFIDLMKDKAMAERFLKLIDLVNQSLPSDRKPNGPR